jgi:hypothetical protein
MSIRLLSLLLLVSVIGISGCTSGDPVYSGDSGVQQTEQPATQAVSTTTVATLGDIYALPQNWDADSQDDGIKFFLNPKDSSDKPVEVDGTLRAILWKKEQAGMDFVKGDMIKEWKGIQVKKSDFGYAGAEVRLEYDDNYVPDQFDAGVLEVRFDTQGKTFTAQADVLLGY